MHNRFNDVMSIVSGVDGRLRELNAKIDSAVLGTIGETLSLVRKADGVIQHIPQNNNVMMQSLTTQISVMDKKIDSLTTPENNELMNVLRDGLESLRSVISSDIVVGLTDVGGKLSEQLDTRYDSFNNRVHEVLQGVSDTITRSDSAITGAIASLNDATRLTAETLETAMAATTKSFAGVHEDLLAVTAEITTRIGDINQLPEHVRQSVDLITAANQDVVDFTKNVSKYNTALKRVLDNMGELNNSFDGSAATLKAQADWYQANSGWIQKIPAELVDILKRYLESVTAASSLLSMTSAVTATVTSDAQTVLDAANAVVVRIRDLLGSTSQTAQWLQDTLPELKIVSEAVTRFVGAVSDNVVINRNRSDQEILHQRIGLGIAGAVAASAVASTVHQTTKKDAPRALI
jgi:ABC-type transporter Mla subunit MlaD